MDDTPSAPGPDWRRRLRRLLPRAVLFIAMALILVNAFRARPGTVEVLYEYGSARQGLLAAWMSYRQGQDEVRRVQFDYRQQGPPASQLHEVQLHQGDYTVELTLTYGGDPPAQLRGERQPAGGVESRVRLRRPLLVRGRGEVRIYVMPSREDA